MAPVACPTLLESQGLAPWVDPDFLRAASTAAPAIFQQQRAEGFNLQYCRSFKVQDLAFFPTDFVAGPFISPTTMRGQFGALSLPYQLDEVCALIVAPLTVTTSVGGNPLIALDILVDMHYMDETDKVVVFAPSSVSNGFVVEDGHPSTFSPQCVQSIDGYTRIAVLSPDPRKRKRADRVSHVRTPSSTGAIVLICTDDQRAGGLQLSISYTQEETLCPNDCKDSTGTLRGVCNSVTRQCSCDKNWGGDDCGTFQGCAGVNASAHRMQLTEGTVAFTHTSTPTTGCGYFVSLDNSDLPALGAYGVGFKLNSAVLQTLDCTAAFVEVRAESPDGPVLRRYCQNDLENNGNEVFMPNLATEATVIYVLYVGSAIGDGFSMDVTAVALTCPGTVDESGFVPAAGICGGSGRCVEVNYRQQSQLRASNKRCVCRIPLAASAVGTSCDTCAFGFDPATYPTCERLPSCPNNCNGNGVCTKDGCICNSGYFGRGCTELDIDVEARGILAFRAPMDNSTTGDATSQGGVDRTTLTCEGNPSKCIKVGRQRGKLWGNGGDVALATVVREQPNTNTTTSTPSPINNDTNSSSASRAFFGLQTANTTAPRSSPSSTPGPSQYDTGILLNKVVAPGASGDYIHQLNIAGTLRDVEGSLTVSSWVQVTSNTNGWLVAKVDAAFYGDGTIPVLEKAALDVQDRHLPAEQRALAGYEYAMYFGVYINGAKKQIDVMVTRPHLMPSGSTTTSPAPPTTPPLANSSSNATTTQSTTTPPTTVASSGGGEWMAVRHFRLGGSADSFFDGTWRFVTIEFAKSLTGTIEGLVYIDGRTESTNPGFSQCFPFFPTPVRETINGVNSTSDELVALVDQGGAIVVGYGFEGALDELRLYQKDIDQVTIVTMGGDEFFSALLLNTGALLAMGIVAASGLTIAVPLFLYRKYMVHKKRKDREEAAQRRKTMLLMKRPDRSEQIKKPDDLERSDEVQLQHLDGEAHEIDTLAVEESIDQDVPSAAFAPVCSNAKSGEAVVVEVENDGDVRRSSSSTTTTEEEDQGSDLDEDRERLEELAWIDAAIVEFFELYPATAGNPFRGDKKRSNEVKERLRSISSGGGEAGSQGGTALSTKDISLVTSPLVPPSESELDRQRALNSTHSLSKQASSEEEKNGNPNTAMGAQDAQKLQMVEELLEAERWRPEHLDPRTWGVFFCGPAARKQEHLRHLSLFLRKRYDVLESSRIERNHRSAIYAVDNNYLLTIEALVDELYTPFPTESEVAAMSSEERASLSWSLPGVAARVIEQCLVPLEMRRVCKNDKERKRFVEAVEELSLTRSSTGAAIAGAATEENPWSDEDPSIIEMALRNAGIEQPSESSVNRQLLKCLSKILAPTSSTISKLKEMRAIAMSAASKDVREYMNPHLSPANLTTINKSGGDKPPTLSWKDQLGLVTKNQGMSRRLQIILDMWQMIALLFSGMSWPSLYISTFGPVAAITALKFDLAFESDFTTSFYITAAFAFLAFLVFLVLIIADKNRNVKDFEREIRQQILKQVELMKQGKKTKLKKSKKELVAWGALSVLNVLYLSVTRNAVIGLFCHKSIQCLYDCYNEPAHMAIVYVSVITGIAVTLFAPVMFAIVTARKRYEFYDFVGDVTINPKLEEQLWDIYLEVDPSPYKSIYDGYSLQFAQFQCFYMVVKALMCFVTLGMAPDTTSQVIAVTLVQCIVTWALGFAAPYISEPANLLNLQTQVYLVLTLCLNCFYRINPDELEDSYGVVLVSVASVSLVIQLILYFFLAKSIDRLKMKNKGLPPPPVGSVEEADEDNIGDVKKEIHGHNEDTSDHAETTEKLKNESSTEGDASSPNRCEPQLEVPEKETIRTLDETKYPTGQQRNGGAEHPPPARHQEEELPYPPFIEQQAGEPEGDLGIEGALPDSGRSRQH